MQPEGAKRELYGQVALLRGKVPDLDRYERKTVHAALDTTVEYFDREKDERTLLKCIKGLRRLLQTSHLRTQKKRLSARRRKALIAFERGKLATMLAQFMDKKKGGDPPPPEMIPQIV
jgi:hypothetical protein